MKFSYFYSNMRLLPKHDNYILSLILSLSRLIDIRFDSTANQRYFYGLLFVILNTVGLGYTQESQLNIASFELDETDLTANVDGTRVIDPQDGKTCALIKVITSENGFTFDVGLKGIVETQFQNSSHPSEIWLYVPDGIMSITIQHPQFGKIDKYDLGGRLKSGRTYQMRLTSCKVATYVFDDSKQQYLDLSVFPVFADVYINGLRQTLDTLGHAMILLSVGKHKLTVKASEYHTLETSIDITDSNQKQSLALSLKPEFGWVYVKGDEEE